MDKLEQITLSKEDNNHLYIQLYNKIKRLIKEGELKPHTKLPPIRKLANKLEVNNVTIVNAYKLLEQEGYVYKKVGSGTYISENSYLRFDNPIIDEEINIIDEGIKLPNKKRIFVNKDSINFASGVPTPDLFPVSDFKNVLNEVLERDKGNAFGYHEVQGFLPLRESVKNYLESYGVYTDIENIQIISGAQQGIDIISKTLIDYGDIVFTESPTYTGAIEAFKSRAARIIEIPIKEGGINLKILENKLKVFSPKFIYLMPNFQNPTGFCYTTEKKNKLLELAKKYDFYIIEDDYLSDLSFYGKDNYPIKKLDVNDRVIYIKSFSKIFMPGLRLAFMVIPMSIYNEVIKAKHTSDISTSGLIQRAFDMYLRKGIWEKHIKYMEQVYKERFDIMIKNIKEYMPDEVIIKIPNGGLNFWFALPDGYFSNRLYEICLENNILMVPGSAFYVAQNDNQYFRLSIGSVYTNQLNDGIRNLSNIINWYLKNYKKNHTLNSIGPL